MQIIHARDTDTPSQMQAFALFTDNSQEVFLIFAMSKLMSVFFVFLFAFFPKAAKTWIHLTAEHVAIVHLR